MTLSELRAHPYGPTEKQLIALCDAAEALARQRRNMISRAETTGPEFEAACTERDEIEAAVSAALSALRDAGLEVT